MNLQYRVELTELCVIAIPLLSLLVMAVVG